MQWTHLTKFHLTHLLPQDTLTGTGGGGDAFTLDHKQCRSNMTNKPIQYFKATHEFTQ